MEGERWDDILDALADPYRRQLLVAMVEKNPQQDDDVDPLNTVNHAEVDTEALRTKLVHQHLPKLDQLGFIEWDRETGDISKGPDWEEVAPLLRLIQEHRHDLPDGWL
jgi:hypothetical protein